MDMDIVEAVCKKKRLNEKHVETVKRLVRLYGKEILDEIAGMYIPSDYGTTIGNMVVTAYLAGIEDRLRVKRGMDAKWEKVFG